MVYCVGNLASEPLRQLTPLCGRRSATPPFRIADVWPRAYGEGCPLSLVRFTMAFWHFRHKEQEGDKQKDCKSGPRRVQGCQKSGEIGHQFSTIGGSLPCFVRLEFAEFVRDEFERRNFETSATLLNRGSIDNSTASTKASCAAR